jgi:hypothetical protein
MPYIICDLTVILLHYLLTLHIIYRACSRGSQLQDYHGNCCVLVICCISSCNVNYSPSISGWLLCFVLTRTLEATTLKMIDDIKALLVEGYP